MHRCLPFLALLALTAVPPALRADAFDNYTNPILAKVPGAAGVQEVKELTPALLAEHNRVLPNISAGFVVVQTNENRLSKLLVQAGRRKLNDEAKTQVPILLIERYVTYREGQERAVQAAGANVYLFEGFHFSLDLGQVVPAALGGDLKFVVKDGKAYAEPVGKAKMYLLTQPLPEATPKKTAKLVIGETFEPRYFNGKYKLYDDGRRSGTLTLEVLGDGDVTGSYYSDKDGQKYDVMGKLGSPKHLINFLIKYPQTEQQFHGFLFTGDGKAIAGTTRLQDRENGFYAVRMDEE